MLFDDVFYPGNAQKREQVRTYTNRLRMSYGDYKDSWNLWAVLLNDAFKNCAVEKFHTMSVPLLTLEMDERSVGECLSEVERCAKAADASIGALIDEMGISPLLPTGWESSGVHLASLEESKRLEIGRIISLVGSSVLAGVVGAYVFTGVTVATMALTMATGVTLSLSVGLIAGAIVSGAGFVITDMISSAITGAIERNRLNGALDVLKQMDDEVATPLRKSALTIRASVTDIRNKRYYLGDDYMLVGKEDGSFVIVKLSYDGLQRNAAADVVPFDAGANVAQELAFIPAV